MHDDPFEDLEPAGLVLNVEAKDWPYHAKALIALNKPAGYECSKKPKHHPSVYSLLPAPLLRRDVQSVGRLDEDTTGLLLFTDDGQLLHRWTSPKHHVPKVYDASCKHPVTPDQLARLLAGVVLLDDPEPVRAISAEPWDGAAEGLHGVRLTLAEGKYPPGQAHDGRGGQSRGDAAPQPLRQTRVARGSEVRRLVLARRSRGHRRLVGHAAFRRAQGPRRLRPAALLYAHSSLRRDSRRCFVP